MNRAWTMLVIVVLLSSCLLRDQRRLLTKPTALPIADYPPSDTPYPIEGRDFWLVLTQQGRLFAFAPISPEYAEHISKDECRFAWSEALSRFVDPCSGDEWELDGRINLKNSIELWSSRDLDQYAVNLEDGMIYVHLDQKIPGTSIP